MKNTFLFILISFIFTSCTWDSIQNPVRSSSDSQLLVSGENNPSVSDPEIEKILQDAYSEELLAEAIYEQMVTKYPEFSEVNNIINSEARHSEQVGALLEKRGIVKPTDFGKYNEVYKTLQTLVNQSETGAIEAGVMIEVGDIDHLLSEYKEAEEQDIRMVFENIGGGSFNHLRAFLRLAEQKKYQVSTSYTKYVSTSEINSSGPLQSKMTELLKANGLPTYSQGGMGNGGGRGNRGTH